MIPAAQAPSGGSRRASANVAAAPRAARTARHNAGCAVNAPEEVALTRHMQLAFPARHFRWVAALALLLALAACAPAANVLELPEFSLERPPTLTRLNSGGEPRLLRLQISALNPNPVQLELVRLEGSVFLSECTGWPAVFTGRVPIPPRASVPLLLDVVLPSEWTAPELSGGVGAPGATGLFGGLVAEVTLARGGSEFPYPAYALLPSRC